MIDSILIIKTSSLGDIVCALPVLAELRRLYPQAHIGWVVEDRFADLLADNDWIDELIVFHHYAKDKSLGPLGRLRGLMRAAAEATGSKQWDVAIDLQGTLKSALLLRYVRASKKIAEFSGLRHWTCIVSRPKLIHPRREHAVQRCLELAAPLGANPDRVHFHLPVQPQAQRWADEKLGQSSRVRLAVCPGSARPEKVWPAENFAQALSQASSRGVAFDVVIVGTNSEKAAAQAVCSAVGGHCIDLTGQTDLRQLVAVLNHCDLMLTCDTGPMHIMAALGKPVVALFGPTNPRKNGPWGDQHTIVQAPQADFARLSPDQVAAALVRALAAVG